MIRATLRNGKSIFINPFWIESVGKDDDGNTHIYVYNNDDSYIVQEDVKTIVIRIEAEKGRINETY